MRGQYEKLICLFCDKRKIKIFYGKSAQKVEKELKRKEIIQRWKNDKQSK